MKEPKNRKKTNEQKAITKLPKLKELINKEQQKTKVLMNCIREIYTHTKNSSCLHIQFRHLKSSLSINFI